MQELDVSTCTKLRSYKIVKGTCMRDNTSCFICRSVGNQTIYSRFATQVEPQVSFFGHQCQFMIQTPPIRSLKASGTRGCLKGTNAAGCSTDD